MKTLFSIITISLFCTSLHAQTDPEAGATAIFDRFLAAMTAADTETVTSLFTEDALFWGTGSQTLVTDPAGVAAYFGPVGNNEPGQTLCRAVDYSVEVVSDQLALLSGMWEVVPPGQDAIPLRVSMAVALRDGDWKIIQFHNSSVPE